MTEFMNWQELAADHRKLKADHEALRKLVDVLVEKFALHVHYSNGEMLPTTIPVTRLSSTPQPTPSPTSAQTQEPGAPAGGTR